MTYEQILTRTEGRVAIVQLNRPRAYNALSPELLEELMSALEGYDADQETGVILITGNEKAFAAGADINFMAGATSPVDMLTSSFIGQWDRLTAIGKPVIAAVSGFVLGGGCELAMACDLIVASETAVFGQPEINLGVIPGAGGTQRLVRAVGKALAMDMVLSGRRLTAAEAHSFGLVNRVWPADGFLEEAVRFAGEVAAQAPIALRLAKQAINAAYEMPLQAGLAFERHLFYMLFATADQKEGMDAFLNKRPATWQGR